MASVLSSLLQIIAPKKAAKGGKAYTATYNPGSSDRPLAVPQFREHLNDIYTDRINDDSKTLIKKLFVNDPDMSAAVNGYLTLANTEPVIYVEDLDGQIDQEATKSLYQVIDLITRPTDYTLGWSFKQSLSQICADMRYMGLMRGMMSCELVFDKQMKPQSIKLLDGSSIEWYEKKSGEYKPTQKVSGDPPYIDLDMPTVFISFFRRDPTTLYPASFFVSAINTIAARQQVINDLYRIMQVTGFPRMEITVMEEILLKRAPANIKNDANALNSWVAARVAELSTLFSNVRPDQAVAHTDAVEIDTLNDKKPGNALDITNVIETLNAQNQAALKTMATVLGRGSAGVNTSSVEARLAAMFADELNEPLAELLSNLFSFILHQNGYQGFARIYFRNAELRPDLELEPQLTLKAARLRQDLSDGIITDAYYHLEMYGQLPPDGAPELSGTGFMNPAPDMADAAASSTNGGGGDALSRSLSSPGKKMSKSKAVKQSPAKSSTAK